MSTEEAPAQIPRDAWTIGMDLGTYQSSVGIFRGGKVELIPVGPQGEHFISSNVLLTRKDTTKGDGQYYHDKNIIGITSNTGGKGVLATQIKPLLGQAFTSEYVQKRVNDINLDPTPLRQNPTTPGDLGICVALPNGDVYRVEEVIGLVAEYLLQKTRDYLGLDHITPLHIVCAVPVGFIDKPSCMNAVKRAVELGGGRLIQKVLAEPTAAALSHFHHQAADCIINNKPIPFQADLAAAKKAAAAAAAAGVLTAGGKKRKNFFNMLVCDLGGGTFDLAVLQPNPHGEIPIKPHYGGDHTLGANLWSSAMRQYLLQKANKPFWKNTATSQQWEQFCEDVEVAKKLLPSSFATDIHIDGVDINITLDEFIKITTHLTAQAIRAINELFHDMVITPDDVTHLIFTGGGCNMRYFREAICTELFSNRGDDNALIISAGEYGVALHNGVVTGAALAAAEYSQRVEQKNDIAQYCPQIVDAFTKTIFNNCVEVYRALKYTLWEAKEETTNFAQKTAKQFKQFVSYLWHDLPQDIIHSIFSSLFDIFTALATIVKWFGWAVLFVLMAIVAFVVPAMIGFVLAAQFTRNATMLITTTTFFAIYFGRAVWSNLNEYRARRALHYQEQQREQEEIKHFIKMFREQQERPQQQEQQQQ